MRRYLFAASIAAAALVPSTASAQTRSHDTCEQKSSTRVVATVGGAGVGGVLGNVIAGQGDKRLGTVIGAVAGAIVGNQVGGQIAKSGRNCNDAYGYYDSDNRWHASGVGSAEARGYYDRDGGWIEGAPNGRYGDDSRWIANTGSGQGEGRYSAQSEWVPASANGYFDRNDEWVAGSDRGSYDSRGRWIAETTPARRDRRGNGYDDRGQGQANAAGQAAGYYDRRGRWVAGATVGNYDAKGRWTAGAASGRRDRNGTWVADPQPGYYDTNGRWHAGATSGAYDSRGRWIPTAEGSYTAERPQILSQLSGLDQHVLDARAQRTLSNREVTSLQRELSSIRTREAGMAHDRRGNLSANDAADLQGRIDSVNTRLRINVQ